MDKEKTTKRPSVFENIASAIRSEAERRKTERGALLCDIAVFLCAFFFARKHIVFGSYPLAVSLVAVLPSRVWIALIGAVTGSLSMGRSGVIHAIIALIILFLRIIISGNSGEKNQSSLFSEPLIMRLSAATIGAFVGAGYEMLLSGFSFTSVLFGVFGVGLTLGFSFVFSGLFFSDIRAADFIYGERNVFHKREGSEQLGVVFFQISFSAVALLLAMSLDAYTYFGISLSYVFAAALTLFISKRFGTVRGAAFGFISAVGVSPLYSPAFALIGAVSGFLYSFGIGYALVGSGIIFSLWGAYVGGVSGFLSLFPEYLISAVLIFTSVRKAGTERDEKKCESISGRAEEMVGASWLSETRGEDALLTLEESLMSASDRIKDFSLSDGVADFEEYRTICDKTLNDRNITVDRENINKISTKLYKKQKFSEKELDELAKIGVDSESLGKIFEKCAEYERSLYEKRRVTAMAEEYGLISKMINESRLAEKRERAINESLTDAAKEVFIKYGFPEGNIKVFGEKKIRVIGAGLDSDGRLITAPDFKLALEEALGVRLGEYEYFRRGEMALFKCSAAPSYTVDYATVSMAGSNSEISGDSSCFFGTKGSFYSVISDGMGSGKEARESSDFVTKYLSDLLLSEVGISTAAGALSHIIRHKDGECTATLDLFRLDLVFGDALFIKSGAAPSYVKRDKSIFRIRSETAPIGLMKTVDAEKIRVEVKSGDYIIMLSDGISTSVEDSAWLLSYLTREAPNDLEEYGKEIIRLAKKNTGSRDDMTVSIIKIIKSN